MAEARNHEELCINLDKLQEIAEAMNREELHTHLDEQNQEAERVNANTFLWLASLGKSRQALGLLVMIIVKRVVKCLHQVNSQNLICLCYD